MLTCKEVTEKASQRIDGDLNLREQIGVRIHLMMCVKCRSYYRQLSALVASLASGVRRSEERPSAEFVARVMTGIDAAREESPAQSEPESPHRP